MKIPIRITNLLSILILLLLPVLAESAGLVTADQPARAKEADTWLEPITGMKFVKIPAGCFQMGQSPEEMRSLRRGIPVGDYEKYYADEQPQHKVCLEEFWMGIHEVSQREWQKVMGFNPAVFPEDLDFPVEMVSWEDAQLFINKINEQNNTSEFRLPTEAEWEYSARAGTTTMYNTGDTITGTQANFNGTFPFSLNLRDVYRKSPTKVGSFPANGFGLYDMHGNVWEWCSDWYQSDYYQNSPANNPSGPETGQMKVLRGGSWFRYSAHIRAATRYKNKAVGQYADTGFRLVKSPRRSSGDSGKIMFFDKDF
jgi:formylglycine-generating enzyme required for sulfatase activity